MSTDAAWWAVPIGLILWYGLFGKRGGKSTLVGGLFTRDAKGRMTFVLTPAKPKRKRRKR